MNVFLLRLDNKKTSIGWIKKKKKKKKKINFEHFSITSPSYTLSLQKDMTY